MAGDVAQAVRRAVWETPVIDVHTHLYYPSYERVLLWGIDELLTYHYLVAEVFRYIDMPYADFWRMDKRAQADLIFRVLFQEHSPVSESCRGVLTAVKLLGLDVAGRDLNAWRAYFERLTVAEYTDIVFDKANIAQIVMTNDPFDDAERAYWEKDAARDDRFLAVLRIDALLLQYHSLTEKLRGWGYNVGNTVNEKTASEIRRFLRYWLDKMGAVYMAASLPPSFAYPSEDTCGALLRDCVLPVCAEKNVPFAMMVGVKKLIQPELKLAGDGVGQSDIAAIERLCSLHPHNKFLVTMLSRENQHELSVAARKFRNLHVFGCWWFLNNPSLVEEMTRMRVELLGLSVTPQHSDARVLDQLLYKWSHSRTVIADVLADKYALLEETGWRASEEEIRRDVRGLLGGAFMDFLALKL